MTEKKEKKAREVRTDLINQTLTKYIKTERTDSNIKSIFNAWENGYFITIEEWLQRCAQEKAWTMRGHEKSVSYMKGLIIEEKTNTQSMSLVNGKRVADLLEEIIRSGTSEYVGIAKQILKKLKDAASKVGGVENIKICIDGQNRGLYAITNFFESEFPIEINFKENPELSGSFYYDELPQTVQDQIDNVKIQVDLVHTLDIERVLDRVIAMNEGESWNPTERRSIRFKPVSFIINQLAADPIVSWFFSQILDKQKGHGIKGVQGDYFRFKKGDILILSELLYYTINGHFGSARQLDAMYNGKVEDEKIQSFEEIVKFIVNIFHTNKELLKEMKLLSMFKDLFICTKILIDENGRQRGAMFGASKVMSLKEVKDKPSYIKSLLKPMLDLYTDKKDRIAVRKKTGVHYEPKPGTWSFHHKSQTQVDVLAREEFLVTKEPKILKKAYHNMVKNNVVHARYERDDIDKMDRMQLELANEKTDYERWNSFEPAHVKSVDHTTPVSRGGSSDISNLGLMPKELNSSKNAR